MAVELEAVFQHWDATSGLAIADAQATQLFPAMEALAVD
jgi:hypothetical protein